MRASNILFAVIIAFVGCQDKGSVDMVYSYACKEYPGMEMCPGRFYAATEDELWKLIELHASVAHNEDPTAWSPEERAQVKALIKAENSNAESTN